MSLDAYLMKTKVAFVWATRKPSIDRYQVSSFFYIRLPNTSNTAFKFHLHYDPLDSSYVLYLNDARGQTVCNRPFKTSVGIAKRREKCLPDLNRVRLPTDCSPCLARWRHIDLLKCLPNFKKTQLLRLDIVFSRDSGDLHLGWTTTDDKSIQTALYWEDNLGLESLSRDNSKLLISQEDMYHDIKLKCGDNIYQVQKSVLSSRSDVFAAVLRSGMMEENDYQVVIEDVDPDIFSEFLRYLYSGKISSLTFEKAMELYDLGGKYAISCLMDLCASFLTEHMMTENTLKCLVMADAYGDQEFKEKVISYILDNKIHNQEDVWLPFCNDHLKVAVEVLNRYCK